MRSNKKIRQRGAAGATGTALAQKTLSRQKDRFPWQWPPRKNIMGQGLLKFSIFLSLPAGLLPVPCW